VAPIGTEQRSSADPARTAEEEGLGLVRVDQWFLTADERGNPGTRLDSRHADGSAWSAGNDVTVLVHGGSYFAELLRSVRLMRAGDLLLFTDWRGDPDQRLDETGNGVARVFADAAARGVVVKGLLWRSHLDQFAFSEQENRHLGDEIEAAGGECLRDMRVRPGGSHHQKFVVLRHPGRPDLDVVAAITNVSRWRRYMGLARPGTMCSCVSRARLSRTSRPCSASAGKIPPG
jgi:phosphatidylserine/phosphatidylglycerophosphate/cardiolipin synthase-like enzyme